MKRVKYPGYASFSDLAEILSEESGTDIMRQKVYMWWKRHTQGFPSYHLVEVNGKQAKLFKVDEVLEWYAEYEPYKLGRGRPRKKISA